MTSTFTFMVVSEKTGLCVHVGAPLVAGSSWYVSASSAIDDDGPRFSSEGAADPRHHLAPARRCYSDQRSPQLLQADGVILLVWSANHRALAQPSPDMHVSIISGGGQIRRMLPCRRHKKEDVVKAGEMEVDISVCEALFQYLHKQMAKPSHLSPTCNRTTPPARREKRNNPSKNQKWDFSSFFFFCRIFKKLIATRISRWKGKYLNGRTFPVVLSYPCREHLHLTFGGDLQGFATGKNDCWLNWNLLVDVPKSVSRAEKSGRMEKKNTQKCQKWSRKLTKY